MGRESVSTIEPRGNSVSEVAARLFCSKSDYMPLASGLGDPYEVSKLSELVLFTLAECSHKCCIFSLRCSMAFSLLYSAHRILYSVL